ncbi:S26 family signal peptidase [Plantactinospora sp. KLBMP9567]|uniref:S26 family signal peptidase n=1 Tax=Plantactinospora sp. KLBMP9567 TaxID=3085900 RepID=UPI002982616C|nr:S26 family signal peptidase [Plantactinospora sp. KLBMP9567]MDW5326955.1 S26 family signal peptidase [Plantactinospora sp. KLBMP9567]
MMTRAVVSAVVVAAATGGVAGWWLRHTFLVTTVAGRSMVPTYTEGDRLLVRRVRLAMVRRGDVVVLADRDLPRRPARSAAARRDPPGELLIIKRAVAVPGDPVPAGVPVPDRVVPPGRLIVLGDNADASYDSRNAGYYAADTLIGVVVRGMRR